MRRCKAIRALLLVAVVASLPPGVAGCAEWCDAKAEEGESHCAHPECVVCHKCRPQVACTPVNKEDSMNLRCERWCKIQHSASHCATCSCKTCAFCAAEDSGGSARGASGTTGPISTAASTAPAPANDDAAPATAVGPPPDGSSSTRLAAPAKDYKDDAASALVALGALASALASRGVSWDDAFKKYDRRGNGLVNVAEVHRIFHEVGLPLPHSLPSSATTVHGVDYHALAAMLPAPSHDAHEGGQAPAAPPPPPLPVSSAALAALSSLANALRVRSIPWEDAFKPFDRKGNGLVQAAELQRVFHTYGAPQLPLHEVPPAMQTIHGVDYRALEAALARHLGCASGGTDCADPPPPTSSA